MSTWHLSWRLTARDVLEGLTASHEDRFELDGHFSPKVVVAHAVEEAISGATVRPEDVRALEIRIEREGAFP